MTTATTNPSHESVDVIINIIKFRRATAIRCAARLLPVLLCALVLLICSGAQPQEARADSGTLDETFGNGGKLTVDFNGYNDYAYAIAVQPDGKILVGGGIGINYGTYNGAILRFNSDGSPDASFGNNGQVITNVLYEPRALVIQPDGKILAASAGRNNAGTVGFAVARYNSDGSVDSSFGDNGISVTSFQGHGGYAYALALQADGKIVAGGSVTLSYRDSDFILARFNSDGSLDAGFGTGGKIITAFSASREELRALVIQRDGKIVASGETSANTNSIDFAIARYNTDGTLDTGFDNDGKIITNFGYQAVSRAYGLAVQSDNKIVAAGSAFGDFALARYNTNGSLDAAFGNGGKYISNNNNTFDYGYALTIQPDGKMLVAGMSGWAFALARFNPNGNPDTSFGNGGRTVTQFFSNDDEAFAVALQPNGKVILAGSAQKQPYDQYGSDHYSKDFAVARYDTGYAPPPVSSGDVIISEFRLRGAAGAMDEFIELYNRTSADIIINAADNSNGWAVSGLNNSGASASVRFVIPNGARIPAHGHYLAVNNHAGGGSYSLNSLATADLAYTTDIPDNMGLALFRTANTDALSDASNCLDAVGFAGAKGAMADLYREGEGLSAIGSAGGEFSFVRKMSNTVPQDTNNNADDFALVSTDGGIYGGVQSVLGAPGPESAASPIMRDDITPALVDPLACGACAPNRVRVGSGNSGTLSIRRHFTNNTGASVSRLNFRVFDITTLGSPLTMPPQADLRLIDSGDVTITNNLGQSVVVKGTTLVQPPAQSLGGGLNSSTTVALPGGGLANGQSIDVQFVTSVVQNGRFRFFINVEAAP